LEFAMRRSPSIVPREANQDIYLVLDDFGGRLGRAWRETDEADTDRETLIRDLVEGQYSSPTRIIAFNTAEGWSRDVTIDIADELRRRFAEFGEVSVSVRSSWRRQAGRAEPDTGFKFYERNPPAHTGPISKSTPAARVEVWVHTASPLGLHSQRNLQLVRLHDGCRNAPSKRGGYLCGRIPTRHALQFGYVIVRPALPLHVSLLRAVQNQIGNFRKVPAD
jgi:hypothetical protein